MIEAIVWDYDGTLVDSSHKNLNVTRALISAVLNRGFEEFPILCELHHYQQANLKYTHWRDMYRVEFGMDAELTDYAGDLWSQYQLADNTASDLYHGIRETIIAFGNSYPQAIVSLNSAKGIRVSLDQHNLTPFFKEVIGYEELSFHEQKPDPTALLRCIDRLGFYETDGVIVYIGDHEIDARCVANTNAAMGRKKVISIGALYEKNHTCEAWSHQPDYIASSTSELQGIVRSFLEALAK